ncbi:MAG: acyltransferase [Candidatus Roizmanbacteria bacterium]|nr:acyltransferase [Candidatus Roizmanbacteria bacterium]
MSEQEKTKVVRRLDVLDGLRGFAIVLVFLNHIDSRYIADAVPKYIRPIIQFFFTSGNLGVTFFFILSGFLMGYLYAIPQPSAFIERRYARIFPPFLVMATCMWFFRLFPQTPLIVRIALILSVAFLARLIWVYIIERFHKGSILIKLFILLQCIVAVWYGFFIMRRPPIWFDSLPIFLKEGSIFASNATLTLALGNYIPLLDGVYWSLAPEMIFYILYPFLFSGTVLSLKKRSGLFVLLFCTLLFPFLFGLSLLFKHTQGMSMLFIEYFIYFCGGIGIATIVQRGKKNEPSAISHILTNPITFLAVLFLSYFCLGKVSGIYTTILRLFLVFPFGYIVYSLIEQDTSLSKFFRKKVLLFLGAISYSMYIGHTAIVDGMHLLFKPTNAQTNVAFLIITAVIFFLVAVAIHYIIETPYFQFKPDKKPKTIITQNMKLIYGILAIFIMFVFFSVYTSQFNFFSIQKKYTHVIPSTIAISDKPYTFSFISQENNMGVILVHLTSTIGKITNKRILVDPTKHQKFVIRMKEEGTNDWYASQDTSPAEIGNSASYPFGFPLISNSKDKTYVVEMLIKDIDYSSTILFNKDTYTLYTVHQIPKQTLLKNPLMLISHIGNKLQTALANPEAQLVMMCILPFFILLFVL